MKWMEAKAVFDSPETEVAAEVISDLFHQNGVKGVAIETVCDEPMEGWGQDAVPPPTENAVIGYFPKTQEGMADFEGLQRQLRTLFTRTGLVVTVRCRDIDEEDWAESWKAFFKPEKIGEKIVVKPSWHPYAAQPEDLVIEIDPGMAFGTGTHPTTALCLRMLEAYVRPGAWMLDVGTGSGILMIAAKKLGADRVWGVDSDSLAVRVAEDNLIANHVSETDYRLIAGNLTAGVHERFDLVAANILTPVIIELLDAVPSVLRPGGILICSGIIAENRQKILDALADQTLDVVDVRHQDGWLAFASRIRT